ncbi:hypothetical protein GX50_07378 [[Emmonsia] crescens]|uniref:Uncharacterized protein n=1 Tax=[Emmonsia] crescens TaxID=73230 RepID=A0A2B7Z9H2_9EURO|nr:hypothetical protein GX50_07378 [Emmonsia crescens]
MKPVVLLHSLLLVHACLCAPASQNIRSLLSRVSTSGADVDLDNSSPTSSYQTTLLFSTGNRPLRSNSSPRTRQHKLLGDLDLNHISDKELRKIILWLTEQWPTAEDLIQSIQELVDIGHSGPLSSVLLPEPPLILYEKPLPTIFLTRLGNQIGREPAPTPSSQITLTSPEVAKEALIHLPISTLPELEPPFISNNPTHPTPSIASSSPTPYFSTLPPATTTRTTTTTTVAITSDNNLFAMLQTMDSIDELIIWASERPPYAVALGIYVMVLLLLISIVIVEVTDFIWTLVRTKLPSWRPNFSWSWGRRRVIHLSGPERRLIAVPIADNDEKQTEMNYGTCDEREQC